MYIYIYIYIHTHTYTYIHIWMGDRITTILFSALNVTTNMQGDVGLGSPQVYICIHMYTYIHI